MSQEKEVIESEFEEEINEQVAAQAKGEEAEPEEVETETETKVEEPVKTDTEVETTATEKKDDWTLTAVMDERDKRQKAVKEAEELRQKLAEFESKPEDDVSIFEDEAAWKANQEEKRQQEIRNASLNMSQAFAEETFGEDKVAKATEWMQSEGHKSPYIVKEFNEAKLPFHKLVKLFDAEQERLNPESLREQIKAELLEELKVDSKPAEKSIAPSLASKRSAGEPSEFPDNPEDILNP